MQEQTSVARFLMLGALETVLNRALELEGRASETLQRLHGTVVRVRFTRPAFSLYLLICDDGVDILEQYEGYVDVRIRCTLGSMLHWILTPDATPDDALVQIHGPDDKVRLLSEALQAFDIWGALNRWMNQHARLEDLLSLLRREDPAWADRLEMLVRNMDGLADELGRQRLLQEDILDELRSLKRGLRRQRQLDAVFLFTSMTLLLAAFATIGGELPVLGAATQGMQALLLASVGLTLLLSRVLFGHRYS